MRVEIITEAEATDEVVTELEGQSGVTVEETRPVKDLTEQAFGLAEAAAIIALIKGAAELVEVLQKLVAKRKAKTQTLKLNTPLGSTTIELAEDATAEDLRRLVEPLFDAG